MTSLSGGGKLQCLEVLASFRHSLVLVVDVPGGHLVDHHGEDLGSILEGALHALLEVAGLGLDG